MNAYVDVTAMIHEITTSEGTVYTARSLGYSRFEYHIGETPEEAVEKMMRHESLMLGVKKN